MTTTHDPYLTDAEGACAFYRAALESCTLIPDGRGIIARKALEQLTPGKNLLAEHRRLVERFAQLDRFSCWAVLTLEDDAQPIAGRITEEMHLGTPMARIDTCTDQGTIYRLRTKICDVQLLADEDDVRCWWRGLGLPGEQTRAVGK